MSSNTPGPGSISALMLSACRFALVAGLAFVVPSLPAQQPSSLGAVQGIVVAADTKAPVLDANVWLQPVGRSSGSMATSSTAENGREARAQTPVTLKTDPAGRFLFPEVKPGEYYVLFSATGFIGAQEFVPPGALAAVLPLPPFVKKVDVAPGKTADVSLSLEHGGAIEGTVRLANGTPGYEEAASGNPAGLAVSVRMRRPDGTFAPALVPAHTDPQGHFRIPDLPAGSYVVFTALPGGSGQTSPAEAGASGSGPVTFYGNSTGPKGAKVVTVQGTQTTSGIDISLPESKR